MRIEMNKTKAKKQIATVSALLFCVFSPALCTSPASAREAAIRFDGRKMSADIEKVPLREVLEEVKRQKKFVVKGDPSILELEVTASFSDLSFQEGLKKILGRINYLLLFGKNNEPCGVIVVDRGTAMPPAPAGRGGSTSATARDIAKPVAPEGAGSVDEGPSPASGMTPPTPEELKSMEVVKNVPTPGGPVEVTEEEMENFEVVQSSEPPGGPVETTAEELESMKPDPNSPPMPGQSPAMPGSVGESGGAAP
jgi:hypothetical protein